jgi:hypothetical protein
MIRSASAGCFLITPGTARAAICRNSVGATVMTVAERGASSSQRDFAEHGRRLQHADDGFLPSSPRRTTLTRPLTTIRR